VGDFESRYTAGEEDGKKEVIWRNLILDIFVRQVGFLEKEFVRGKIECSGT